MIQRKPEQTGMEKVEKRLTATSSVTFRKLMPFFLRERERDTEKEILSTNDFIFSNGKNKAQTVTDGQCGQMVIKTESVSMKDRNTSRHH